MASAYFTVLGEDRAHFLLVYRLLRAWQVHERRIRQAPMPEGAGSGEQSVRERLPPLLADVRRAHRRVCLVVITDADVLSVESRKATLAARCAEVKVDPPEQDDPVSILIPKRAIETWLRFCAGDEVDEATPYPKYDRKDEGAVSSRAAQRLAEWLSGPLLDGPPSLVAARSALLAIREAARA